MPSLPPARPPSLSDQPVMDVSCGDAHNCALTASCQAYCWGDNSGGQLGIAHTYTEISKPRAILIPTGVQLTMVACGANFTVALSSEYTIHVRMCTPLYMYGCARNLHVHCFGFNPYTCGSQTRMCPWIKLGNGDVIAILLHTCSHRKSVHLGFKLSGTTGTRRHKVQVRILVCAHGESCL